MKSAVNSKSETIEKKKAEDKGFFLQLPCYLIDEYQDTLTSTAFVAFLRFIRKYSRKGEATYKGSYRGLAKELNISHTSAIRVTDQWQETGLATKNEDEESDMLTVFVSLAHIWQKNIEHSKKLNACPTLSTVSQNITTQQQNNGSVVTENSTAVINCDTAVKICYSLVTFCDTFEDKSDPRYIEITKILRDYINMPTSDFQKEEDSTPTQKSSSKTSGQTRSKKPKVEQPELLPNTKPARTPKIEVVLTADGTLVAIEWDKARGPNKFTPRTKQFIEDANALALTCKGNLPTAEKFREARGYLFTSNPKFYRDIKRGGITLHDVVGAWAAFEDSLELQEAGGLGQGQPAASQGQHRDNRRPDQEKTSLIVPDDVAEQTKQQNFQRAVAKFEGMKARGEKVTVHQYNWAKRNGMDMTGVELEEDFSMAASG